MVVFSMIHTFEGKEYLLNLIDTPVGFSFQIH